MGVLVIEKGGSADVASGGVSEGKSSTSQTRAADEVDYSSGGKFPVRQTTQATKGSSVTTLSLKNALSEDDFSVGDELSEIGTAFSIVFNYFTGTGPEHRDFDETSIQSFRLSQTPEFDRVRKLFFKNYGDQLAKSSDWTGINATNFGKTISFFEGLQIAWDSPTGALVGTFTVESIIGGPNRTLTYTLSNSSSLSSLTGRLFGEISYERPQGGWGIGVVMYPGSTISQTYTVKEEY
ncbi:hypothetical protein ACUR5C_13975 [Aliikangiella sp. IMCC44653]